MRAAPCKVMRKTLFSILVTAGLSACTGSGQVTYSGEVQPPQLVEVSPGVQVIADYDQPVFYSDSYYWRYDNGVWYRSREHTRGWARVEVLPPQIRTIDRPQIYVHYHGRAQATLRNDNVEVRDQREEPVPPPTTTNVDVHENHEVIEHRYVDESPSDTHKDAKEKRKDAKEQRKDAKEQRKDAKEQRKQDKERREEEKHD